ncbi:UDP-glucuronate 4-epimerase [Modicisalibacter ilicicola DSM 19980]|uniref:UDP-glucuronate 4-epimerase n=1 Tax=Modicisalibacter ilicicola DSM 19980 TaxID=1121942 RepID=A0A1M5DP55_9GAMM|nr:NAD-dependent epimerase/dehydratase family protein [Halomonas ilicicola]SHF68552.1 UDP-glucuronate 4-epimerase [Halomonas ilicicola DSM 19980]
MRVLITGMAGFIGHALARRLARNHGHEIVGIDNLNDYYDVAIKQARLNDLADFDNVRFQRLDLTDEAGMQRLFAGPRFDCVVHLAAQAGVRYSLDHPQVYGQSNLIGHLNVLEGCRRQRVGHLVYASSSSVYGLNARAPFSVEDSVDQPVSLYAATKKSNELMAHAYSHLYGLPTTGLRFFTVYGPWGRPDMALFKFTRNILDGKPIELYNQGVMSRDFTYIDDITESIVRIMDLAPEPETSDNTPYRLYNIGHGSPVNLVELVRTLEEATGLEARCDYLPMQPGDMQHTWADAEPLFAATGFRPSIEVAEGVRRFVAWYRRYHDGIAVSSDARQSSSRLG